MTEVATIDREARCQRTWGVLMGADHYRADVIALPIACQEPPAFMAFTLRPIPTFPPADDGTPRTISLEDWFMVAATQPVARMGCELVSAKLTQISADEYATLAPPPPPEPVSTPEPVLAAEDFAGPNRAQRRAAQRPGKRKRR